LTGHTVSDSKLHLLTRVTGQIRKLLGLRTGVKAPVSFSRGVHYFGSHDPVSFLDAFRPEEVRADFQAIRGDGFDTVCLLLPWHALFPDAASPELDPWHAQRLDHLLSEAGRAGLRVHGRLFYAYSSDVTAEVSHHERQLAFLLCPARSMARMKAQADHLVRRVTRHKAWAGGFVTWEDFWPCFETPPHWAESQRHELAMRSGFSDWVEQQGLAPLAQQLALPCNGQVWIVPTHHSPAMQLWVWFFDHVLRHRVMAACLPAFPDLGVEIRIDAYPVPMPDGQTEWLHFDLFNDWHGPRYLYWGPFHGMANQGEQLDASAALEGLKRLLLRFGGVRRPVIDQFNFTDETLLFARQNARLRGDQVSPFILDSAALLRDQTAGCWLWAYRDYRENWLVNSTFQQGGLAWGGSARFDASKKTAWLKPGTELTQDLRPFMRAQAPQDHYGNFSCDVEVGTLADASDLRLCLGSYAGQPRPLNVGRWRFDLPISALDWQACTLVLRYVGSQELQVKSLCLYGFVQRLGVRDELGQPGPHLKAVQALNQALLAACRPNRSRV